MLLVMDESPSTRDVHCNWRVVLSETVMVSHILHTGQSVLHVTKSNISVLTIGPILGAAWVRMPVRELR